MDFLRPGHVFPLVARDGGVLVRTGHTEASIDLAKLAGLKSAAALCEIAREDGEMMRRDELIEFAQKHNLKIITIDDLVLYRRKTEVLVNRVASSEIHTKFGLFNFDVYKDDNSGLEHVLIHVGDLSNSPIIRVHSECLTGEVFYSKHCDCKEQLDFSLKRISEEGKGAVLYLRGQEGRGIGLSSKIAAYKLQSEGHDTVEANEILGFKPDLRDFGVGAQILNAAGVRKFKLLTNNPKKLIALKAFDLEIVERIPVEIKANEFNKDYLKTKKTKLGHLLDNV